jgi:KipI family sensor histidine kinase inhibitor
MRLLDYGPAALLVELDGGDDMVVAWAAAINDAGRDDVAEVVPAATTVLVTLAEGADRSAVADWLRALDPPPLTTDREATTIEIAVTYDGEDVDDVAAACGLTGAEVVARHTAPTYRCAFCGFAPGFAYLTGLDPRLHLPRRSTPRTRVPAGSVAIAAGYSAVYPAVSPGGWHLLGHSDAVMFDPARDRPALVEPGDTVRFVAGRPKLRF